MSLPRAKWSLSLNARYSFFLCNQSNHRMVFASNYDVYVAICKPLLYAVNKINRLCNRLLLLSFLGSLVHAILHHVFKFRLCVLVAQLCLDSLQPHGTVAHQALLFKGLSRQEDWSGLPFPPPGNLPDPGINVSCIDRQIFTICTKVRLTFCNSIM